MVAADLHPSVGSADVAVPPGAACGALSLRCRFATWLAVEEFDPDLRTGFLEPEVLEQARSKRAEVTAAEIAADSPRGSVVERETDTEPEYQDLQDDLEKALARLRKRRIERDEKPGEVVPFRPPSPPPASRWVSFGSPYAMAASILLVVTLGLSGGMVWQSGELEDLERERSLAKAELDRRTQEQQRLDESHRQEVAELRQERQQADRQYEQRIADLEQRVEGAGSEVPLVDLPFAWLSPQEEPRGEVNTLSVSAAASYLVLILEINDPEPYSSYRLEIRESSTNAEVFASELSKTGLTEVSVALPRRLLAAGEYQLRVYGLRGAQAKLVEKYALRVELE